MRLWVNCELESCGCTGIDTSGGQLAFKAYFRGGGVVTDSMTLFGVRIISSFKTSICLQIPLDRWGKYVVTVYGRNVKDIKVTL